MSVFNNVVPLESNPDVLNKYLNKLGFPTDKLHLVDVFGLEDDLLNFLPQPVKAFVFLFPYSDTHKAHRDQQDEKLKASPPKVPENVFYMKQFVQNACGTMALIHAVLNLLDDVKLADGSVLKNFYDAAKPLDPIARGKLLTGDKAFIDVHQEVAEDSGCQTAPDQGAGDKHHYNAIVAIGNELYELDGNKNYPISHGATTPETFLFDAARVCKEFIAREPTEQGFTILALANAQ